jgi:hypothetical protein
MPAVTRSSLTLGLLLLAAPADAAALRGRVSVVPDSGDVALDVSF